MATHLVVDGASKPLCGSGEERLFYLGAAENLGQGLPPDICVECARRVRRPLM